MDDVIVIAFKATDFEMKKLEAISDLIENEVDNYELLQVIALDADDFDNMIREKLNKALFTNSSEGETLH